MNEFKANIKYKKNELLPILSEETIEFHYGKHHCWYANMLNKLIVETKYSDMSLENIIVESKNIDPKIFNNAAQLFNHDFYWESLKITNKKSCNKICDIINQQFNSFDEFLNQYIDFAGTMFGSGWSWLVFENGKLSFFNTQNAETPIGSNQKPICVVDLWEHAYYIDYRNNRPEYINKIIRESINWHMCGDRI